MSSANEKFSFPLLLDGSLRDGHIDAKYQSEDAPFEYDLLHTLPLVIMNENELRPIPGKNNGYYRILWQQNNIDHRSLPHFQLNDIEYINGYQLKEDIRSSVDTHSPRQLKSFVTPEKASILLQYQHANHADNNHTFNKVTECQKNLTDEQRLRAKQNTNLIFQFCSDIFNKNGAQFLHRCSLDVLDMNTLPKQYVRKQCKRMHLLIRLYERLILSLIGIHLPSNIARRIQLVLDYYEQYRSKINFNIADKDSSFRPFYFKEGRE
ncbi:unnamed protein product [Didymodactylos carnosus]|uniref:Uncharacterized protein n=1 Tax=Didymodactylos carnosus TaxID=1234261 RepID=A0A816CWC2_9BILA|nr:unnamed protein product [Didymodactylos carnosus]CAF4520492.1 unnamed protein product [Didymodactylos carnosus]